MAAIIGSARTNNPIAAGMMSVHVILIDQFIASENLPIELFEYSLER